MDPKTFGAVVVAILGISIGTSLVVLLVGWICFKPERVLRKVYPYIRESGNNITIFGFIIKKKSMMGYQWLHTVCVIAWILFIVLFNTFLIVSYTYNPYDDLNCFGYYNSSEFELVSEEQIKMDNVTDIRCYGWNLDIAGGIGHAAAILTLSWLFSSIVLWIKLKLYYKANICIENGKKFWGFCGIVGLFVLQSMFALGGIIPLILLQYRLSPYQLLDITLFCLILLSGSLVFPSQKEPKSLTDCCKEAVENKEEKEEGALDHIKERLKVEDYCKVDLLLELAKLECKKALGYNYYYGIKRSMTTRTCSCMDNGASTYSKANNNYCSCINPKNEEEAETNAVISEKEMKIIAQVAYYKVTTEGSSTENNNQ